MNSETTWHHGQGTQGHRETSRASSNGIEIEIQSCRNGEGQVQTQQMEELGSFVYHYTSSGFPEHERVDPSPRSEANPKNVPKLMTSNVGNFRSEKLSRKAMCCVHSCWLETKPLFSLPKTTKFQDPWGTGYFDILWREFDGKNDERSTIKYIYQ